MEEINSDLYQLNIFEENKYNFEPNPNLIYEGEIIDDCRYDSYQIIFNFDVYNLNFDKEKTYISLISDKDNKIIKIIEFYEKEHHEVLTLKDHKYEITSIKHYFDNNNNKDYLLSNDLKGNVILYEILSINEYILKQKINSQTVRNKNWTCSVFNQNNLMPGINSKFGCIYKPYNFYNPMKNNIFGMNKMNLFGFEDFENQFQIREEPFIIDYIDSTLLFFTSKNNYILILYRESASLAIYDLETLESKGRIYDQSSVNSLVQWFNSEDNINYVIISGSSKIEITNPFDSKNKYTFKDNNSLKGRNYSYSIMYNFKSNNDYLLSYNGCNINIMNLNTKIIESTIEVKNNINCVLPWNKKYLIVVQGNNYGHNKFSKLWIIHIDSKKVISEINGNNNSVKGAIKKILLKNNKINLFINNSDKRIEIWGIKT